MCGSHFPCHEFPFGIKPLQHRWYWQISAVRGVFFWRLFISQNFFRVASYLTLSQRRAPLDVCQIRSAFGPPRDRRCCYFLAHGTNVLVKRTHILLPLFLIFFFILHKVLPSVRDLIRIYEFEYVYHVTRLYVSIRPLHFHWIVPTNMFWF